MRRKPVCLMTHTRLIIRSVVLGEAANRFSLTATVTIGLTPRNDK
jgi:hypothetical protein